MNKAMDIFPVFDGYIESNRDFPKFIDNNSGFLLALMEHSDSYSECRIGIGFDMKSSLNSTENKYAPKGLTNLRLIVHQDRRYDASELYIKLSVYKSATNNLAESDWDAIGGGQYFLTCHDRDQVQFDIPLDLLEEYLASTEKLFKIGMIGIVTEHEKGYTAYYSSRAGEKVSPKLTLEYK